MSPEVLASRQESAKYFYCTSWKEFDYRKAMEAKSFDQCNEDMFQEKLYYAGGCVRAFAMKIEAAKGLMYQKFVQLSNYNDLQMGLIGSLSSSLTVNSFIACYEGEHRTLISEYIAKLVGSKCSMSFVQAARRVWSSNPAWQGWVTEMEVLAMAREGELALWDETGSREVWSNIDLVNHYDVSDAVGPLFDGLWIVPKKWNHGLLDALHMKAAISVSVVQITEAETHTVKLASLIPFVIKHEICDVEIVIITSKDNLQHFKIPKSSEVDALEDLKKALEANIRKRNDPRPVGDLVVRKVSYQPYQPYQPTITVPSWRTFEKTPASDLKALVKEKGGTPRTKKKKT